LPRLAQQASTFSSLHNRRDSSSPTALHGDSPNEFFSGISVFVFLLTGNIRPTASECNGPGHVRAAFGTTETRTDAITLPDALLALTRLCLLHYAVDEKTTVTKLPQPDARQQEILKALGVSLPAM
jgi:hypothetical protein